MILKKIEKMSTFFKNALLFMGVVSYLGSVWRGKVVVVLTSIQAVTLHT